MIRDLNRLKFMQNDKDNQDDVELKPGANSDTIEEVNRYISSKLSSLYEVYSYRHAAAILKNSFPNELTEIENALLNFKISLTNIASPGGSESDIPKKLSSELRPHGWHEARIQGDLLVRIIEQQEEVLATGKLKYNVVTKPNVIINNYIDGHKIDYVKDRVALDLEWNSKDQTFDRDLYAFRMFHECGIISVAVIITRSKSLNVVFNETPLLKKDGSVDTMSNGKPKLCKQKYGASTTWMGKLLYRLNAGRHGGCPVLVFGITPEVIVDWKNRKEQ
jgi:CRISPR-associated protein Csd2